MGTKAICQPVSQGSHPMMETHGQEGFQQDAASASELEDCWVVGGMQRKQLSAEAPVLSAFYVHVCVELRGSDVEQLGLC